MFMESADWVNKYREYFLKQKYDKTYLDLLVIKKKGKPPFSLQPVVQGFITINQTFLQEYLTDDGLLWAQVHIFDHSQSLDIKSRQSIIDGLLSYSKYSMYHWSREYLNEAIPRLFPYRTYKNGYFIVVSDDGKEYSSSTLTHQELLALQADNFLEESLASSKANEKFLRMCNETLNESEHIEKPVRLWIGGCDDTSYAKCFETVDQAMKVLNAWKKVPPTYNTMNTKWGFTFTN